jgi:heme exporter protein A
MRLIESFSALCHTNENHHKVGQKVSDWKRLAAFRPAGWQPVTTLSAEGLECRRGGRTVFSGLAFSVRAGEALAVTGRNGAGKSSLLRVIAGLVPVAAGRLTMDGDTERSTAERTHYLGHLDALKTQLSVAENLRFWIDYLGGAASATQAALDKVGLGSLADLPAAYLSAGQKRRLSLARLAAIARPLWLLDEPASSLDDAAQAMLTSLMRDHLNGGGIIVAATHAPLGIAARELRLGAAA